MKEIKGSYRPAGKFPTRVPAQASPALPTRQQSLDVKKTHETHLSSHAMITRSRAEHFRLMGLPPELRSHIYGYAFSGLDNEHLSLNDFMLPPLLAVSRELRTESLPVFFSDSHFKASVRSNFCVRNGHLHANIHKNYETTGTIALSPFLLAENVGLPKDEIRFRQVDLTITCVCCVEGREIASVTMRVAGRKPLVQQVTKSTQLKTRVALILMFDQAERMVKRVEDREIFNGFSVDDIVQLAKCFRFHSFDDGE